MKVIKTLVFVALLNLCTTVAYSDQLADILDKGIVKIAIPENFPPFGSVGKSLEYEGYDVDVAKLIGKDLGVKLELVPVTSKQRIPFLSSGKVDLVVSSLGASTARAKSIWFSSAYAPFFAGAFASKSISVSSIADLSGKKVGLTGGTLEDLELSEIAPKDTKIVRFGDNAMTISAFVSGQIDILVTGNTVAARVAADNPELEIETKLIISDSPAFIGVRSGEINILQWVNVFILDKKLSGELNALSEKWFGQPLPALPTL